MRISKLLNKLNGLLRQMGLQSDDDRAESIFTRLLNLKEKVLNPKSLGVEFSVDRHGNPTMTPVVRLNDAARDAAPEPNPILDDSGLTLLNRALNENDISVWVLLDRLDEAFVGVRPHRPQALRPQRPLPEDREGRVREPDARQRPKGRDHVG
jgi:hypothetical protein